MSGPGSVVLEHVSKRFGEVTAVDDVSLEVGSGEFFSLLGPSGCGKTTSLRMIAGFEHPDSGRVVIGDADVGRLRLESPTSPAADRPRNSRRPNVDSRGWNHHNLPACPRCRA